MGAGLDSTKVLSGNFGKVHHDGSFLTNVYGIEANLDLNYEKVKRAGRRVSGNKLTDIEMSGSIQAYQVTRKLHEKIGSLKDFQKGSFVTQLHAELDDPDNPEMRGIYALKGVQFQNLPLINFEHGSLVEEELQFVFEDYELIAKK